MEDVAPPIARRAAQWRREAPPSAQQEHIWLAAQLTPDAPTYSVAEALALRGTLDVAALRTALNAVVARHEALRTRFALDAAGELRQVIAPEATVPLLLDDLCADPDPVREARRHANRFAAAAFDLAVGPPFRALLLRLGATEHWLVISTHHIVTDGWSRVVFWRDLAALYEASLRGEPAQLQREPLQYADYACWQRGMREREEFARRRDYWRRTLAGAERVALPVDRLPAQLAKYDGSEISRVLDPSLVAALVDVGRRSDATLFMTLFAALLVWLSRHSGTDDLAVGFASAGRDRPEVADVVGCFVRTLVLRVDLAGSPLFSDVLLRVRTGVLEALAHQDAPLDLAARDGSIAQHRGLGTPWFDVFFNMRGRRTSPTRHVRLGAAEGEVAHLDTGSAKFALSVTVSERADGRLEVRFAYASALFDTATIDRMQIRWLALLQAIVDDERRPIARLPMLGDDERALLARWSGTLATDGVDVPLAALFAEQVRRAPEALAVVWDGGSLSYAALGEHAGRLAQTLRRHGVRRDIPVGVYIERSPELVVALLAILEAGGAYLPVDPDYPQARIERVLEDAKPPVVLTQLALRSRLPEHPAEVVSVDLAAEASDATTHAEPPMPARSHDLAYLIYTSGSTGQPKGVMIEQRSVATHVADMRDAFAVGADDCVLHTAAIGFDQAIGQIVMAVLTGARVALPSPQAHRSADEIAEAIVRHGVTILRTVPTLLGAIASGPGFDACRSLRLVLSAGEPLAGSIVEAIHAQCAAEVVNGYGPSEATFMATIHRCSRGERTPREVPIGLPLPHASVHLLDGHGEAVPIGTIGEICIGGAGICRGYWGRPDLAQEAFIPDPFSSASGARLYRTGDRGRYRADGVLEFVGRRDRQVKIRGCRVELGEIDGALAACPGVAGGVADAGTDASGALELVAYVVPAKGTRPTPRAVREHLARTLPRYMIPSRVVEIPELPLSANGKIDRARLPALARVATRPTRRDAVDTGNGDPIAGSLATLWAEVLELAADVAPADDDNFFDAGGNSLAAMRLLSRVRQSCGASVAVADFFARPTLASLARLVNLGGKSRPIDSDAAATPSASPIAPRKRNRKRS